MQAPRYSRYKVVYNDRMEELIIKTQWWHVAIALLGLGGTVITVAWTVSGRLARVETDMKWLRDSFRDLRADLKVERDNEQAQVFATQSPAMLTDKGKKLLEESGLKNYIDENKENFMDACSEKTDATAYEVQEHIFDLFGEHVFPEDLDRQLKEKAYEEGIGVELIRRIGAIYLRDLCLEEFGKELQDIDKTNPNNNVQD